MSSTNLVQELTESFLEGENLEESIASWKDTHTYQIRDELGKAFNAINLIIQKNSNGPTVIGINPEKYQVCFLTVSKVRELETEVGLGPHSARESSGGKWRRPQKSGYQRPSTASTSSPLSKSRKQLFHNVLNAIDGRHTVGSD
jgi:hypothetical protein